MNNFLYDQMISEGFKPEQIINETDYSNVDVRNQITANEKKVKELLSKSNAPEAKEALKILLQNEKLLNRKYYMGYSEEERSKRAGRSNEKYFRHVNENSGAADIVAKELNKQYAGKTFKDSKYSETIKITEIKYSDGYIVVRGDTGRGYGVSRLEPYELMKVDSLVPLAKRIKTINQRTSRRMDDRNYEYKEKDDLSDKKRQSEKARKAEKDYFNY